MSTFNTFLFIISAILGGILLASSIELIGKCLGRGFWKAYYEVKEEREKK